MFEALGFNKNAELVYLRILQFPDENVAVIAHHVQLAEARVDEALDELTRMSLVRAAGSDPRRALRPVDPTVGLARLLDHQRAELARRHQDLEESRAAFTTLIATHTDSAQTRPRDVQRMADASATRSRIAELTRSCQTEVCAFEPGGTPIASFATSQELDTDTLDRGIRMRILLLDSMRHDHPTLDYANWLVERGGEVRTVPALPLHMFIVDRAVAVVAGSADGVRGSAMVLSVNAVLEALMALFQSTWRTATPLGATRHRDQDGLSAQERQVLRLLGEGRTDETVSRRLGVSVRTARRVASHLHTRLGAQSRFQAGALAFARGWIDDTDLT